MDTLEQREKKKYKKIWQKSAYKKDSFCETAFPFFLQLIEPYRSAKDHVIDFGCGGGKISRNCLSNDLTLTLVDITSEALVDEVLTLIQLFPHKLQFIEACLWNLPPKVPQADWIFCCDVLEHIPPSKIDAVFEAFFSKAKKGGFLLISTRPDNMGALINETLHLSVFPAPVWKKKIEKLWMIEKEIILDEVCLFFFKVHEKSGRSS